VVDTHIGTSIYLVDVCLSAWRGHAQTWEREKNVSEGNTFPSLPPCWKIIKKKVGRENARETFTIPTAQFTTLSDQKSPPTTTTTTTSRFALSYTRSPPSRPVAVARKPSSRSVIFVPSSQPNFFKKNFSFLFNRQNFSSASQLCLCISNQSTASFQIFKGKKIKKNKIYRICLILAKRLINRG
jgi:hypothetical protein